MRWAHDGEEKYVDNHYYDERTAKHCELNRIWDAGRMNCGEKAAKEFNASGFDTPPGGSG